MEIKSEKKKYRKHSDRIVLSQEVIQKLNEWMMQLEKQYRSIKISRSDLVNTMLSLQSATLGQTELAELGKLFFDEVRFTQWALQELKAAKARGENISLNELLQRHRPN